MSDEELGTIDGPADDLQADAPEPVEPQAQEGATPPAEAPAEATQESPEDDEAAKIRDAAFKMREAKRQAAEERAKREEVERKLAELTAPVRPDIPPYPDPYDNDFAEKIRLRDAAIAQAARWDGQQAAAEAQRQWEAQERARREQEETAKAGQAYAKKAETLGVSPQELQTGGALIAQFGVPQEIMARILRDDRGPEITAYLGKNPDAIGNLVDMHPMDAAVYLETVVKPNAKRPPRASTPPPPRTPEGSGYPEGQRGPAGTTYN